MPDKKFDPLSVVAPGIGAALGLGAAAIQRKWALRDWERQNEYNSPVAQVQRNKEAGLPLAAMFGGSGGSTSSDVRGTPVDPTLGVAQGMQNYFQNRLQKKQIELLDAQIDKTNVEAYNIGEDYNRKKVENQWFFSEVDDPNLVDTNMFRGLNNERKMKEANRFIQEHEQRIREIEKEVKNDLHSTGTLSEQTRNQVGILANQVKLSGFQVNNALIEQKLLESLNKDGLTVGEAFIHSIMKGIIGVDKFTGKF